ncbi:MAG: pyridoxamine 5'-phosphate oxidase family protein [Candidatus Dadabacteria bacterium]|nr:pyridoxamine 5'-phosphate oxidase family protein [Candidatus Dadabacteria bacterium]
MKSKFHSGEIAVQTRAGVRDIAQRVSRVISSTLPHNVQYFLEIQSMVIIGSIDGNNHVQASVLTGNPGFIQALDERTIRIDAMTFDGDPLIANLKKRNEIGILAIDLETRHRLKVKGEAQIKSGIIYVTVKRAYAQCPKYIQAREAVSIPSEYHAKGNIQHSENLSNDLQKFIATSDTFFISTYHEDSGVDVSHRGGNPGFVKVLNQNKIVFPDYSGNSMFNTLGNISVNPGASLLFIDFQNGSTIQLTGEANIIWDDYRVEEFAGAERIVEFEICGVVHTSDALPLQWQFLNYSPFNPI